VSAHWVIMPVALPMAAGIIMLLANSRGIAVQRAIAVVAALTGLALATWLFRNSGETAVYRLGDWAPPFGIVLVLDRLSALMVLLTAVVALFSLLYAFEGADETGPYYHPLFQLQLMGLNGAFLTGDLFNLFVFFEILLIASYCLLVHGTTKPRLHAGIQYVVLNLAGSALFLIAAGLLYGLVGTLNMADLAMRVPLLPAADAGMIRAAALLLLIVFALKAALVPLYFWLPSTYSAASAPVAALFAIMTKVGVYCITRVYTLIFGPAAGVAADVAVPWLLPMALITLALGMIGALASRELRRMQGYLLISSVGVMLSAIALFDTRALSAGLYYLVHSTLTMAAMFLIADLIDRERGDIGDLLVRARPLNRPALLGAFFFAGGIAVVGLPPLSGFVGKLLILDAVLPHAGAAWIWAVILGGSLLAVLALSRAGIMIFWDADDERATGPASSARASVLPAAGLLAAVVAITVLAGPLGDFTDATAQQLLDPQRYISAVLGGVR
jgi:multicomponent K+:H+ antiporter subunit D